MQGEGDGLMELDRERKGDRQIQVPADAALVLERVMLIIRVDMHPPKSSALSPSSSSSVSLFFYLSSSFFLFLLSTNTRGHKEQRETETK